MTIPKIAGDRARFARPGVGFRSARAGFRALLTALELRDDEAVLLPDYIGWSAREGSGVFDPVRELGVGHAFYRVDRGLRVDLGDVERLFREQRVRVLVVIHYFGWPDPAYERLVALARTHGAFVLEDEAHAMLTDLVGGASGRLGDAALFSLHKLLPVGDGGMVVFNTDDGTRDGLAPAARGTPEGLARMLRAGPGACAQDPWSWDLRAISDVRRRNAEELARLLAPFATEVTPLWNDIPPGVVPQTFPIVVQHASRDALYDTMNAAGFGAVSLYHTLISDLAPENHADAHWLARRIFNLPLHQDVAPGALAAMVTELARQLEAQARSADASPSPTGRTQP